MKCRFKYATPMPFSHVFIVVHTVGFVPRQKGLRDRNSPTCTLSQNGYGASSESQMSQHYFVGASENHEMTDEKVHLDTPTDLADVSCVWSGPRMPDHLHGASDGAWARAGHD